MPQATTEAQRTQREELREVFTSDLGLLYTKLGAKIPKGVLLVGSPGTGQTLTLTARNP